MDEETLRSLAAFPGQLERHYSLIPDSHKSWAPDSWDGVPSESLTAIEQVWHVLDIEVDGYHRRFLRTLAETDPVLESLDTYALARERRYKEKDGAEALAAFRQARSTTIALYVARARALPLQPRSAASLRLAMAPRKGRLAGMTPADQCFGLRTARTFPLGPPPQ